MLNFTERNAALCNNKSATGATACGNKGGGMRPHSARGGDSRKRAGPIKGFLDRILGIHGVFRISDRLDRTGAVAKVDGRRPPRRDEAPPNQFSGLGKARRMWRGGGSAGVVRRAAAIRIKNLTGRMPVPLWELER